MPKQKKAEAGAPAWMVTFADLMSLLVCFFVLIISFSIQDTVKLQVVAGSMKDAFGVTKVKKLAGVVELDGVIERQQAKNVQLIEDQVLVNEDFANADDGQEAGSRPNGEADLSGSAIEQARLNRVKAEIENALLSDTDLAAMADQVTIQMTEDGLSIVMVDQQGRSMFAPGAVEPNPRARKLIQTIAGVVAKLPNRISIDGHTAAGAAGDDFDITSGRANAARNILKGEGLGDKRIYAVSGKGASEPLFPDDPYMPGNRRVVLTLMRAEPVLPSGHSL
ncbi:MAG: flagellar motor protein MotB [Pseudomonadota bacterium]